MSPSVEGWEHLGYRFHSIAVDMSVVGGTLDAHLNSFNGCNTKCGDSQSLYHLSFNFLFIQKSQCPVCHFGGFNDPVWNHLKCMLCIKWFFLCDLLIQKEEANILNYGFQRGLHLNLPCFGDKQVKAGHFLPTWSLVDFHCEICKKIVVRDFLFNYQQIKLISEDSFECRFFFILSD